MRIAIVGMITASWMWGQLGPGGTPLVPAGVGVISGVIRDAKRTPLRGVTVLVSPDPSQRGVVTPYQGVAVTAADGSYTVRQVPAGSYWVCPQMPMSDYLDPCIWDAVAPAVKVGATGGAVTPKQDVTVDQGEFLWVQVEDAGAVLDKHKGGRGEFRVSVKSPRGERAMAAAPIHGTGRKVYRVLVPKTGKFQPELDANDFVLEHGPAAARGASPFGVETALGAGEKRVLIVNVRGGK